jgi:hypothetical protein
LDTRFGLEKLNVFVTVATVVVGVCVATVVVRVVVLAVLVDVILGKGNALEQYVTAGSNYVSAAPTTAGIPPLQKGLAATTIGTRAAREPQNNNFAYNMLQRVTTRPMERPKS